ncbi:MAG: hypothetical protein ACPIE8_01150 [Henriciella sp.]
MDFITLLYFGMIAGLLAWGLGLCWAWSRMGTFAGEVYDSNVELGMLSKDIDREAYIASYIRTEGPRAATYRCLSSIAAGLLLPILIAAFNRIWDGVWRLMGAVEGPFERGYMLHTFLTFVFVMLVIVGMLYLVTAYYYRFMPPTLAEEVERLKGEQ